MLTFEDLLAAKVAIQLGALTPDAARASLKAAHASGRTLAQEIEQARTVDAATARTIAGHARRCSFLKAESTYVASLRRRAAIDEPTLEKARLAQHQDGLRQRLGERLVREGKITQAVDQAVLAEARQSFTTDNAQVTERYVQRGFEDIERYSATVAEVLGQAPSGKGTGPDLKVPQVPQAPAPPGLPGMTPPTGVMLPPRATRLPPQVPRPPVPVAAPDPAGDLGYLGHSAEIQPGMRPRPQTTAVATAPTPPTPTPRAPAEPSPLLGTGLEERYEVVKKVGEGGMGAVYLAKEIESGRDVALKVVLDREKSQEAAQRFKREILATSMCDHENIIQIYDAGPTKDGSYFMAMEFVKGEELADTIKREGFVAVGRTVDLFEQILEGIAAVHSAGIVHRDLKPQNFRIWTDAAGAEHVKIMDFGIARMKDQDQQFADQFYRTMGGKITGSPAYIAPESITEPDVDNRADLYSLGVALFRTVTGRLPFTCKDPMEYLPKHLYEKPPVPSEFTPERKIPKALDDIILKLLEKTTSARYQTAEEVLADLREKVRPVVRGKKTQLAAKAIDPDGEKTMTEGAAPNLAAPDPLGEVTVQEAPPTPEQIAQAVGKSGPQKTAPQKTPPPSPPKPQKTPPPTKATKSGPAPKPPAPVEDEAPSAKKAPAGKTKAKAVPKEEEVEEAPAPEPEAAAGESGSSEEGPSAKPLMARKRYSQADAEKKGGCFGFGGK